MPHFDVSRYNPQKREMVHCLMLSADSPRDAAERAMQCNARRKSTRPYHPDHRIPVGESVMVSYTTASGRKLRLQFVAAEKVGALYERETPRFVEPLA